MNTIKTDIVVNPIYKAALVGLKTAVKLGTENAKKGIVAPGDYYQSASRRYCLLAYTFLRGKTYSQVESNPCYLRPGFFGNGDSSLRYHQKALATVISGYIPKDLGDGTTEKDTVSHVLLWLSVGGATRDQIIADRVGIEANREALKAVGVAWAYLLDWNAKVDRITRDRAHAEAKDAPNAALIARYTEDRNYAVTKAFEAMKAWMAAKAAVEAPKTQEVAA